MQGFPGGGLAPFESRTSSNKCLVGIKLAGIGDLDWTLPTEYKHEGANLRIALDSSYQRQDLLIQSNVADSKYPASRPVRYNTHHVSTVST